MLQTAHAQLLQLKMLPTRDSSGSHELNTLCIHIDASIQVERSEGWAMCGEDFARRVGHCRKTSQVEGLQGPGSDEKVVKRTCRQASAALQINRLELGVRYRFLGGHKA